MKNIWKNNKIAIFGISFNVLYSLLSIATYFILFEYTWKQMKAVDALDGLLLISITAGVFIIYTNIVCAFYYVNEFKFEVDLKESIKYGLCLSSISSIKYIIPIIASIFAWFETLHIGASGLNITLAVILFLLSLAYSIFKLILAAENNGFIDVDNDVTGYYSQLHKHLEKTINFKNKIGRYTETLKHTLEKSKF